MIIMKSIKIVKMMMMMMMKVNLMAVKMMTDSDQDTQKKHR